jgi:hypothetical protein
MNEDSQMTLAQLKLQVSEQERVNSTLKFEVDQLRYDNQTLSTNYEKERQTVEVLRKVYNTAQAKEYASAETQTYNLSVTLT